MFQDSKIASKIELGKGKLKYVVNYGITPFFTERLKKKQNSAMLLGFDVSWACSCCRLTEETK